MRNLTIAWRTVKLRPTAVVVAALSLVLSTARSANAQAPGAQELGPEQPAYPRDLDRLRAEMKAAEEANNRKLLELNAQLYRLSTALDEERARRRQVEAEARLETEATRRAIEQTKVIHAGRLGISINGFVQADAVMWNQRSTDQLDPSTGNPINQTRFLIRRARLRAELDYRWIAGALEFDGNTVNGSQARIIGAEASFVWRNRQLGLPPYLMFTIGLFKTPFGFEIQQSDKDRLFLERSNTEQALFPGEYDLGARLQGGWRFVRWQLAAMNGDPLGEKAFPGRDPNQSKDFVGRVGVDTRLFGRVQLAAGFSADYGTGFHKGTAASKDTLVWRDSNEDGVVQLNEITVIRGQTASPSMNFGRYALGGDLELILNLPRLGELTVYGEIVAGNNIDRALQIADPIVKARDLRELGFYIAVTQELTQWGMVGLRYDRYDPDRDSNDLRGGVQVPLDSTYSTLAIAAAARYPGYGRLVLEYDHNTNPLGRRPDGTPTTLASDALTLRAQVQF